MGSYRAGLWLAFADSIFRACGALGACDGRRVAGRLATGALLLGLGAAMVAGSAAAAPVPVKTIKIFNNSPNRLYPVIETSMTPADEWLQGIFRTVKIARDTYAHTQLYRVYILPVRGLAPGASVVVDLPFYSELVANPKATIPDQYIDWWNGARVYLYDDGDAVAKQLDKDKPNAITSVTKSITCDAKSLCGPLTVYTGTVGLPVNDPDQLTEYTFADVTTSLGVPFPTDLTHVDYDISYVDQVYLPVAIEPLNNKTVGFIGSVQDTPGFRDALHRFLTATPGWPTYVGTPPYPHPRIPGAYNVFIGGPDITKPGPAVDQMVEKWRTCTKTSGGGGGAACEPYKEVNAFFQMNYAKYLKLICTPHLPQTEKLLIQHVYGWVPFNENCENAASANPLKETPGYGTTINTYVDLQYQPPGVFNPFVDLIHGANYLNMNAYAFSIDDAVGNMNEVGDGLVIAVGGKEGLDNGRPFDKDKVVHVNLGTPKKGFPKWSAYGVCTREADQDINPAFLSFAIYTVDYPCKITIVDSTQKEYTFVVRNEPPDPIVRCGSSTQPAWCGGINVKKDENDVWYIETPDTVK